jgi:hypothetical protein
LQETEVQREEYKEKMNRLNEDEIMAKCRIAFKAQEREKEKRWDENG